MTDFKENAPAGFAPIDFRAELNDEQYAAVTAEAGAALVLAGAGSGKTRTLTYRVAYLLYQGIKPYEILLLTFTNKSASEMLERVEALTGIGKQHLWGGTFHSIAQRILRIHGEAVDLKRNYTILDQGEAEGLLKNAITAVDPKFIKGKNNPKPKVGAPALRSLSPEGAARRPGLWKIWNVGSEDRPKTKGRDTAMRLAPSKRRRIVRRLKAALRYPSQSLPA